MSEAHYPWKKGDTLYADQLNAVVAGSVQKIGDTMTGPLQLPGKPTTINQAATKQYVDDQIAVNLGGGGGAGGASITVSDTPPAIPANNQLWWDSVNGQLYLWYNDGSSTQWVNATNA